MAAGPFVVPDLAKLNLESLTNLLAATAANYRVALVTSAWVPANSTDEVWATASGSEIATGNGYTTGGAAVTATLNQTTGTVKFTTTAAGWTASGTGIPAWRRAVLYYLGTLNSKVNPIVAHCLGDSTLADVPLTTSGNPLLITPHTSGVITIT